MSVARHGQVCVALTCQSARQKVQVVGEAIHGKKWSGLIIATRGTLGGRCANEWGRRGRMLLASLHAQCIQFLPYLFATPLNSQWVVYAPELIFQSQVLGLACGRPCHAADPCICGRVEQPPCTLSISASTAAGLYLRHRPECPIVVR